MVLDLPKDCRQIKVVDSLKWLLKEKFSKRVNAVVFPRELSVDLNTVEAREAFMRATLEFKDVRTPNLYERFLLKETQAFKDAGHLFRLRVSRRNDGARVEFFHDDDGFPQGRILCTYFGAPTEWLRNEDATFNVEKQLYDPKPGAVVRSCGLGHLWHIAARDACGSSHPLIHRRPNITEPRVVLDVMLT